MKIDPYKHKERYENWKNKIQGRIPDLSEANSEIVLRYLSDMEEGKNVSSKSVKGARSYTRLNNLRQRICSMFKRFEDILNVKDVKNITEEDLFKFFEGMRRGEVKRKDKTDYKSVADFVRIFKAFWHWHQKVNRKDGVDIPDITIDLDTSTNKPKWVYLTEEQIKRLCDNAKYEYRVLIMFLYDTGIRSPTELMNVRISDFFNNFKEVQIREESSKTFGRRIKILKISELIKEYVQSKNLGREDLLFQIKPYVVNKYLQRLAKRIFGDEISEAGERYSKITMYDLRHCSCCYWLPRYKSESALKYRFGWKKSDKIHYYSEMLGMKDTISEDDLLIDVAKTEIEKRLMKAEGENGLLKEKIFVLENQMSKIQKLTEEIYSKVSNK